MALSASLTTNEVKDRSGTEVEFSKLGNGTVGRSVTWAPAAETPNLPHRITLSHEEVGAGLGLRRRSVLRVDKTQLGDVSGDQVRHNIAQLTLDIPVGDISTLNGIKDALAELTSLVATNATTTFVYDGTGNGAAALLNGSIV
jgi:hypothetical protein